jgi:hypothetical protein
MRSIVVVERCMQDRLLASVLKWNGDPHRLYQHRRETPTAFRTVLLLATFPSRATATRSVISEVFRVFQTKLRTSRI